ncbi:hypothetical protein HYC85_014523 [Camellia sinensis]|uniref:Uncharacterized protein n=1 Tax=Camellia sinensis TaxID=4442 RepID=A0A7J7H9W9_CAMSI|nr:hypothetical protein HYC85_014523 [Camellia sinensis]
MARYFDIVGGDDGDGVVAGASLVLCMIVMFVSIMSMIIFACGTDEESKKDKGRQYNYDAGGAVVAAASGAAAATVASAAAAGTSSGGGGC